MTEDTPDRETWSSTRSAFDPPPRTPRRVRIVLAERRPTRRVHRTRADVEEQTHVGELLLRQLVREQLNLAVRLGLFTLAVLFAIPAAFALVPSLRTLDVYGLRLPWLVLGVMIYPFLLGIAWIFNRGAERNEQEFAEMVES